MKIRLTESQLKKIIKENSNSCDADLFKKINNRYILNTFRKPIEEMIKPHIQNWNGDRKKYEEILNLIGKAPESYTTQFLT